MRVLATEVRLDRVLVLAGSSSARGTPSLLGTVLCVEGVMLGVERVEGV